MNNENINRLVEETLNSFDGAKRAIPKPFLLTRIKGRMQQTEDSAWDNALRFLSRPAVAMACVLLVIAFNAVVFTVNHSSDVTAVIEEPYAVTDDYSSTVAVLNDIENIEP